MPHAIRPGDVLAGRYQLVDLLDERTGGLFWRAYDSSLDRSVAMHIIRADDERAILLRDAARTSARVVDRRLLRVLDVDETTDRTARDGTALCYVVNEWATGVSLDILLADEGPLAPRRAAWMVSEVAGALEVAHAAGVAHGRLVPENVLIDRTGSVRVIGFAVDAALHGLPVGRVAADVTDLAGNLYAALTARWPGVSSSLVKPAPHAHGRVLRPRQVRAGVPRVLDALCDTVLNPDASGPGAHARGAFDLATAGGIGDALREFVGDPAGMAAAEVGAMRRREAGGTTLALPRTVLPPEVTPAAALAAAAAEPEAGAGTRTTRDRSGARAGTRPDTRADPEPEPELEPETAVHAALEPAVPVARQDQPTEAGLPIFDDDGDVAWIAKRADKPAPPPPFEALPERPLFAPDPADGSPVRHPRSPVAAAGPVAAGFWPWDTSATNGGRATTTGSGIIEPVEEDDFDADERPGRSWLWLAALVAALALVLLAVVVGYNVARGRDPLTGQPDAQGTPSPSGKGSAHPALTAYDGVTATDFDPQGEDLEEHPELAALAVDGNPRTSWRTMTYTQQLGPGGLKTGVGLVLDLGAPGSVGRVDVSLVGRPTGVAVYVTDTAPRGVRGLTPAATATVDGTEDAITLDPAATGRYVTLWLTSLPAAEGGFRGEVAEVSVLGTPA